MSVQLLIEQLLNGIQFGFLIFLISAGLTLVLGIMNLLNLTHGALYMLGAYIGAWSYSRTSSFFLACALAICAVALLSALIERLVIRHFYDRGHLDQLLATFGVLLFINEMTQIIWGAGAQTMEAPPLLSQTVEIFPGLNYPIYRLVITAVGIVMTLAMYHIIRNTRAGMMVRACASNRMMLSALGINVHRLFLTVFCVGAALAALGGMMVAPLVSIDTGMGDAAVVLCFVIITIGGLGSIRGAFIAAIMIGVIDTLGRALLPMLFGYTIGPALASVTIYFFMTLFLIFRPEGLFKHG